MVLLQTLNLLAIILASSVLISAIRNFCSYILVFSIPKILNISFTTLVYLHFNERVFLACHISWCNSLYLKSLTKKILTRSYQKFSIISSIWNKSFLSFLSPPCWLQYKIQFISNQFGEQIKNDKWMCNKPAPVSNYLITKAELNFNKNKLF